jgi:hypothetical protein
MQMLWFIFRVSTSRCLTSLHEWIRSSVSEKIKTNRDSSAWNARAKRKVSIHSFNQRSDCARGNNTLSLFYFTQYFNP